MRTFPSRGCPAGAGPEHRARTKVTLMLYEYQGFWKCKAHCDIESCTRPDGKRVFIATELPCNPGTSITNMAEELATAVRKMHGIFTDQFIWIEHYPAHQDPSQPHLVPAFCHWCLRPLPISRPTRFCFCNFVYGRSAVIGWVFDRCFNRWPYGQPDVRHCSFVQGLAA